MFVALGTPVVREAPVVPVVFERMVKIVKIQQILGNVVTLVTLRIVWFYSADHRTWSTASFASPETWVCGSAYIDSLDI